MSETAVAETTAAAPAGAATGAGAGAAATGAGVSGVADEVSVRLAAVFLPAPLPRDSRVAFWDPDDRPHPAQDDAPAATDAPEDDADGDRPVRTRLTVVRRHGTGARRRTAPALTLPVGEALPHLVRARRDPAAHPATACWGAAARGARGHRH
ncbi:ATP-dependent helicase, partial [Streptomyces seoulensis]